MKQPFKIAPCQAKRMKGKWINFGMIEFQFDKKKISSNKKRDENPSATFQTLQNSRH